MEYLVWRRHDAAENLALEETLLNNLPPAHPGIFLLWQNAPVVIIGRHQNIWRETNQNQLARENIKTLRRITGGGAVYHDLGNLNFSFISGRTMSDSDMFGACLAKIRDALSSLNVKAVITGRNDLEVEGKKVSGCARYSIAQKMLVHGTLLVKADTEAMSLFLTPGEDKFCGKGVKSVAARVASLADYGVNLDNLQKALIDNCATARGVLDDKTVGLAKMVAEKKYGNWQWNYGLSPAYSLERSRRFPWGGIVQKLAVRQGVIMSCGIEGDFFANAPLAELEALFSGQKPGSDELDQLLSSSDLCDYFIGCDQNVMRDFLLGRD